MPRLLERDDVMRTAVNLGRAEKVWSERLVTGSGDMTFKLPESGMYQVVFVRVENKPTIVAKRPFSARRKCLAEELMHLARKLLADGNVLLAGFAIAAHSTTNSPMPPERLKAVLRPYQDEDLSGAQPAASVLDFPLCCRGSRHPSGVVRLQEQGA